MNKLTIISIINGVKQTIANNYSKQDIILVINKNLRIAGITEDELYEVNKIILGISFQQNKSTFFDEIINRLSNYDFDKNDLWS